MRLSPPLMRVSLFTASLRLSLSFCLPKMIYSCSSFPEPFILLSSYIPLPKYPVNELMYSARYTLSMTGSLSMFSAGARFKPGDSSSFNTSSLISAPGGSTRPKRSPENSSLRFSSFPIFSLSAIPKETPIVIGSYPLSALTTGLHSASSSSSSSSSAGSHSAI